jgi:hypothetical protein
MAVFFVAAGGHSTHPITLGWLANNVSGHYKRAFSTAIQISLVRPLWAIPGRSTDSIKGTVLDLWKQCFLTSQAPKYPAGYATSLALMLLSAITAIAFASGLHLENKKEIAVGEIIACSPSNNWKTLGTTTLMSGSASRFDHSILS